MKIKYKKIIIEMTNREAERLLRGIKHFDDPVLPSEIKATLNNFEMELKKKCVRRNKMKVFLLR